MGTSREGGGAHAAQKVGDGALRALAAAPVPEAGFDPMRGWNFLTSHARVLLAVALEPQATVSQIAETVILSRRSVFRILDDLQAAGFLRRVRSGRRNTYVIDRERPIAEPLLESEPVSRLAEGLIARAAARGGGGARLQQEIPERKRQVS